jgi:FHA domain
VSHRIELRLHNQAITIEGRATTVQAITIRAHPQDCDRLRASLDVPHLLRTYGLSYLHNAVSEGWQVITPKVTITLVSDERRRRGWPRVLAGRALSGDQVVAVASVTISREKRRADSAGENGRTAAHGLRDPQQTRPYQPPTLRLIDKAEDDLPMAHSPECPSEHPTVLCEDGGREVHLHGRATIGRSKTAKVRTSDPATSREHAILEHDQDGWWIKPLSHNSTRVDGKVCTTRTHLRSGAVIELSGRVHWAFTTDCPRTPQHPRLATLNLAEA